MVLSFTVRHGYGVEVPWTRRLNPIPFVAAFPDLCAGNIVVSLRLPDIVRSLERRAGDNRTAGLPNGVTARYRAAGYFAGSTVG